MLGHYQNSWVECGLEMLMRGLFGISRNCMWIFWGRNLSWGLLYQEQEEDWSWVVSTVNMTAHSEALSMSESESDCVFPAFTSPCLSLSSPKLYLTQTRDIPLSLSLSPFSTSGTSEEILFIQRKENQASFEKLKIKLCKIVFRVEFIGICFYAWHPLRI